MITNTRRDSLLHYSVCAVLVVYGFIFRLNPILRYGVLINEFDPWFNYRCSEYMWKHGISEYFMWFDSKTWVPTGRDIRKTTYPMVFIISNMFHRILNLFVRVEHYTVCCILPSVLFLMSLSLLWKICSRIFTGSYCSVKRSIAVSLFSISGGLFEKTIAGAYDYEGLSMFWILLITYIYIIYIEKKNTNKLMRYSTGLLVGCAQSLFNLSWGGSLFTDILICSHSVFLLNDWKFHAVNILITICVDFITPFLSPFKPINIIKLLVFISLRGVSAAQHKKLTGVKMKYLCGLCGLSLSVALIAYRVQVEGKSVKLLEMLKKTDKIYNVFVKKRMHPLVASITEHRKPDAKYALKMCGPFIALTPLLVLAEIKKLRRKDNKNVYIFMLAGLIFSSLMFMQMERFAFLVAPFLSVFVSDLFTKIIFLQYSGDKSQKKIISVIHTFIKAGICIFMVVHIFFSLRTVHDKSTQVIVAMEGRSNGKRVVIDDFRESAIYMRYNLHPDSVIISWWDYGYQITGMSKLSTVIDNNTNNYDRISEVAEFLIAPEQSISRAHPFLQKIVPDQERSVYIYTVCGYFAKYNLSDLNKFPWIARIAKEVNPSVRPENYYFKTNNMLFYTPQEIIQMDIKAEKLNGLPVYISQPLRDSLLYKLAFYQYTDSITLKNIELVHQSSHHIVRVYKIVR